MKIDEVIEHPTSSKINNEVVNLSSSDFDQMLLSGKGTKDSNRVQLIILITQNTSTFNNVVRSQGGIFFIMHENIRSFGNILNEFHSFATELNRVADVIVLSETWFSANTCQD